MAQTGGFRRIIDFAQDQVIARDAQQSETDHQNTGDGARLKCHGKSRFQSTGPRRVRRPDIGSDGDVHADIARRPRQDRADGITDRDIPVEHKPKDDTDNHTDRRNGRVLAVEVGVRPLLDRGCDFLHPFVASACRRHHADRVHAVRDRQYAAKQDKPVCCSHGF